MIPKDIREQAFEALARQTGCRITYQPPTDGNLAEGKVELQAEHGKYAFHAEVKPKITGADTLLPLLRTTNRPEELLVITHQLKGDMAEQLRINGVQFIDDAGNAFINRPPFYVFIKGNKNPAAEKPAVIGRAFKQTGLRVLYALLCNPGMENETYRMIAGKTGVALGMVDWVMRELRELGYLAETGTGRNRNVWLINKGRLLERWIPAYAEQLRPRLLLGRFRGTNRWWENADLDQAVGLWGGEVAAARMTDYLKPEDVIIYAVNENPGKMLAQFRLKKEPQGNVALYARFWKPETVLPNGNMVHPILVYADLLATGNQRNLETARMIYERHILQLIGED